MPRMVRGGGFLQLPLLPQRLHLGGQTPKVDEAGGLCLIDPEFMTDVVGIAVIVVVIVLQIVLRKHSKPAAA